MSLLAKFTSVAAVVVVAAMSTACSGSNDDGTVGAGGSGSDSGAEGVTRRADGGASSAGGDTGSTGGGGSASGATGSSGGSGAEGDGGSGGSGSSDASAKDGGTYTVAPTDGGGAPDGFWDAGAIPVATQVMTFAFVNRTNGKFADSEVYWSFKSGTTIDETHSIADEPYYDMPANSSGRMYFYLCAKSDATCASDPTKSLYYDFIEHTIGPTQYNGNTTRVDAFGIKIAMRMHCADGFDTAVGEDYDTFAEDRTVTFQKFVDAVPTEFKPLAQPPNAPYRIVQPGADGFEANEMYATYYDSFVDTLWSVNGIDIPKPGPNGDGLGSYPDLSAAIYRHVGATAGTFDSTGKLLTQSIWADSTKFYQAAPADYYAQFWHQHALGGKAYGFPYDDVGGYSSYITHDHPQYMVVAIGW